MLFQSNCPCIGTRLDAIPIKLFMYRYAFRCYSNQTVHISVVQVVAIKKLFHCTIYNIVIYIMSKWLCNVDPFRCLFHTAMPCTLMTCNCCESGVLGVVEFQVLSIVNFICKAVKEDFCHFSPVKDRVLYQQS